MIESIALTEVGPAHALQIDFAPRLNVFAGDNGLGKSFLLDVAWWALTGCWAGEPAMPGQPKEDSPHTDSEISFKNGDGIDYRFSFSWIAERWDQKIFSGEPDARILALFARSDGGFCIYDPFKSRPATRPGYSRLSDFSVLGGGPPPLILNVDEVWNGKRSDGVQCRGMIEDWRSWMEGERDVFARLKKVLQTLSPDSQAELLTPGKPMRVSLQSALEIPSLATPYGLVPITHASAGVKRGLGLAYMLVWAWREHRKVAEFLKEAPITSFVLLFDEVEAHLHPKWQRVVLPAVLDVLGMLDFTETQIVAVTHAPLVLASLETRFDPQRDALFKFDLAQDQVMVEKVSWRPRGDVSSWLTSDIFDLGEARSLEAERAIQAARQAMADPTLSVDEVRRLHHELHAVLKEADPFWPRWLARAAAAGIEP